MNSISKADLHKVLYDKCIEEPSIPLVIAVPKPNNPHYIAHDMINKKERCTNEEFNIAIMRQICPNPHYIIDLMVQEEACEADDELVINHGRKEIWVPK